MTPKAKGKLEALAEELGMKEITMMSRLIEWFADQDDVVQRGAMGHLPPSMKEEIVRLALKRLAPRKRKK